MSGSNTPPVPTPKPEPDAGPETPDVPETFDDAQPVCGTYEVGQILISGFDVLEVQPNAGAPGMMRVTAIEFSYVPDNPGDDCFEIELKTFSTIDQHGTATERVSALSLLLQSDGNFWNTSDLGTAFKVAPQFGMSAQLSAKDGCEARAPGRLYVRFHCSGED